MRDESALIELSRQHPGNHTGGARILDDVSGYLSRFVSYPSEHCLIAQALWIAHAHLMDVWDSTPRIAFLSPEKGSGKTRALEAMEFLVPRPIMAVNVSPAYLFRKVDSPDGRPTILYDEIDTVFGPRAKESEELRGLLNAGHRKGAVAGRCVVRGKDVLTEEIPAYCAVALAGLHNLPDTITSRSVIINMRRRAPGEAVEPWRERVNGPEAEAIRDRLEAWAASTEALITGTYPKLPAGITDRDADVWEALIAVADAAGGDWPKKARVAAVTLVSQSRDSTPSLGIQLLTDLKGVFGDADVMSTESILTALHDLDESPWGDLRGKPLDARGLARYLKPYGVHRTTVRIGPGTAKGYRREDLYDPWQRYLSGSVSPERVTGVTEETAPAEVTPVTDVTHSAEANAENYRNGKDPEY